MPSYNPPLRDMQFVMHEVLKVSDEFKAMPPHAEVDVDTPRWSTRSWQVLRILQS